MRSALVVGGEAHFGEVPLGATFEISTVLRGAVLSEAVAGPRRRGETSTFDLVLPGRVGLLEATLHDADGDPLRDRDVSLRHSPEEPLAWSRLGLRTDSAGRLRAPLGPYARGTPVLIVVDLQTGSGACSRLELDFEPDGLDLGDIVLRD